MTASNSFFRMYAGERKNLIITVDDMTDLSGFSVTWALMENEESTSYLIEKSSAINTSANVISVPLLKEDTSTLEGDYYYQCKVTDSNGEDSVVAVGEVKIKLKTV